MKTIHLILSIAMTFAVFLSNTVKGQIIHTEDFEAYATNTFPSTIWGDVRDISIPVTAPNPSAQIIETLAWDSTVTKAIQFKQGVTTSCGIYREVDTSQVYRLSADIRIDQWSNSTQAFFTEWAVALGIFSLKPGWDFNGTPQITFVAQPFAENWVLYALRSDTGPFDYYNLEYTNSQIELDTWYHVEFSLDDNTGIVHTRVTEKATGVVTHEAMTPIPNWTAGASGNYLYYGTWDGEYNTNATIGNQATVDNFQFSNELSTSTSTDIEIESMKVFPNPAREELFIEILAIGSGDFQLELIDQQGKSWSNMTVTQNNSYRYSIADWPRGIYFARIKQGKSTLGTSIRFVKI